MRDKGRYGEVKRDKENQRERQGGVNIDRER